MSYEDKKDFCITHFFNPVRYMGLLEIVSENINDIKKINFLKNFCENSLGKGVIICKDTPGLFRKQGWSICNAGCDDRSHKNEIEHSRGRCSFWKTYGHT